MKKNNQNTMIILIKLQMTTTDAIILHITVIKENTTVTCHVAITIDEALQFI